MQTDQPVDHGPMTVSDIIGVEDSSATFSPCRAYRYTLWRRWEPRCQWSEMVAFVGLNPSTADETEDDPTIRRCIGFAKSWGFGGLVMLNLFALRATDPKVMKAHPQPIGEDNDYIMNCVARSVGGVVACWGNHGGHRNRSGNVLMILRATRKPLWHLGLSNSNHPKHPLYLRADTERIAW
jgi:hypothetical protein